jgi:hypothetical protein
MLALTLLHHARSHGLGSGAAGALLVRIGHAQDYPTNPSAIDRPR